MACTGRAIDALAAAVLTALAPGAGAADDGNNTEAGQYATCAAYYFNAVNARPMGDYEALYVAGETAFNEALKRVDRKAVDDLVAKASIEMKQLIGASWLNFHRADIRYGARCAELTGYEARADVP